MIRVTLVCCGLLAADPPGTTAPTAAELASFHAAEARAGRDPEAHVRLALWCEAHGLKAERLKHLALAVLADPSHAAARGLMGLVADGDKWRRPEQVADRVRADAELAAKLADYNARRAKAPNTADAHWRLALWCERQGLKAEATAHYTAVTRLEPSREAAWKKLGCKRHNGRWMTPEQIDAEQAELEAQQKADRRWRPLLEKWKGMLRDKGKRPEAEAALAGVTDPRAVPSVWRAFARGRANDQERAIQVLGQIDAPAASHGLAVLAVFAESSEARRRATETLRRRDPRDVVGFLIGLLRAPIKYEIRPVGGPGSPGALFVAGKRLNDLRIYAPLAPPNIAPAPGDRLVYDEDGLPVVIRTLGIQEIAQGVVERYTPAEYLGLTPISDPTKARLRQEALRDPNNSPRALEQRRRPGDNITVSQTTSSTIARQVQIPVGRMALDAQRSAAVAQQQLQGDIQAIEGVNSALRRANDRVLQALVPVTGQDFGQDDAAWRKWWTDAQGYAYTPTKDSPKPTVVEEVPLAYQPQSTITTFNQTLGTTTQVSAQMGHSCFGAGTPVRTLSGPRPIESLRVGDRVLTQDTRTGELGFRPVLAVYHNPPNETWRVGVEGQSAPIVVTGIHRFWKAGYGWVMARDLKPGDPIRTLGGPARVVAVEPGKVQPVFNLEVAANRSFFVGDLGLLVHDNSLVRPTPEPFDAAPDLASLARRAD
jgi:hypothetical protein